MVASRVSHEAGLVSPPLDDCVLPLRRALVCFQVLQKLAVLAFCLAAAFGGRAHAQTPPANRVLGLKGDGGHVALPAAEFKDLTAVTIEGWVFRNDEPYQTLVRFFGFGQAENNFSLQLAGQGNANFEFAKKNRPAESRKLYVPEPLVTPGRWIHLAAVAGPHGMRLYVNGRLYAEDPIAASLAQLGSSRAFYLGRSEWEIDEEDPFTGQMDDIRVWNVERTEEEVRTNMNRLLTGKEAGLFAWWNFDDGTARDATGHGHDGRLVGTAQAVPVELSSPQGDSNWAIVHLNVRDDRGEIPIAARLVVERPGQPAEGYYLRHSVMSLAFRGSGPATFRVLRWDPSGQEIAGAQTNVLLQLGHQSYVLTVPAAATLEGKVSDSEGHPQEAIVSLMHHGSIVASALADSAGVYSLGIEPSEGNFTLRAKSSAGLEGESRPFSLTKGRQTVGITVKPARSMEGKLLALDDTPLAGRLLKLTPLNQDRQSFNSGLWVEVFSLTNRDTSFPKEREWKAPWGTGQDPRIDHPVAWGLQDLRFV